MKQNKLTITIHRSVEAVFEFTINPKNTPKWIDSIELEEASDWPIKLGTIYRNRGKTGGWNEYMVTALEPSKIFELAMKSSNYHVRYTYTPLSNGATQLEYYEWVDEGELEDPIPPEVLQKLKVEIEKFPLAPLTSR